MTKVDWPSRIAVVCFALHALLVVVFLIGISIDPKLPWNRQ